MGDDTTDWKSIFADAYKNVATVQCVDEWRKEDFVKKLFFEIVKKNSVDHLYLEQQHLERYADISVDIVERIMERMYSDDGDDNTPEDAPEPVEEPVLKEVKGYGL